MFTRPEQIPVAGDVEVAVFWTAASNLDSRAVDHLLRELSSTESRRAQSVAFAELRRTYVAAHALLRRVLRAALEGEEPCLICGSNGRPELAPPQYRRSALFFNLTHTRDFAACAILRGTSVGIDAEDIRRPIDIETIAGRWFAAPERRYLASFAAERRSNAFFRIWTSKEAILKATGHGLRIPPERISIAPDTGCTVIPEKLGIPTRWRLAEFVPVPHIRVAVAVPGRGGIIPSVAPVDLA
jgi:phosphopantetheinyl transferase